MDKQLISDLNYQLQVTLSDLTGEVTALIEHRTGPLSPPNTFLKHQADLASSVETCKEHFGEENPWFTCTVQNRHRLRFFMVVQLQRERGGGKMSRACFEEEP